jgi:hypothetical protein
MRHVAVAEKKKISDALSVGKPEGKKPLGRP